VSDGVEQRLAEVRERVRRAAERAGRRPEEVLLVGASKGQAADKVVAAVRGGLRHVGENYVQEALPKQAEVRAKLEGLGLKPPSWHFIGHLQRNKARLLVGAFDVLETLDARALGDALERRAAALDGRLSVLVQVNVSGEPQKAGVAPDALPELLAAGAAWPHLELGGLMAIPAPGDAEQARPAFARLRALRDALRDAPGGAALRHLSMGMSGDFEVAVEEGATIVRVGTALFGPRPD
jgi:pyridoxal phosphate enzyme (YggS family)